MHVHMYYVCNLPGAGCWLVIYFESTILNIVEAYYMIMDTGYI